MVWSAAPDTPMVVGSAVGATAGRVQRPGGTAPGEAELVPSSHRCPDRPGGAGHPPSRLLRGADQHRSLTAAALDNGTQCGPRS